MVTKETLRPCCMRKIIVVPLSSHAFPHYILSKMTVHRKANRRVRRRYTWKVAMFNAQGLKLSVFPATEYRSRAYQLDVRGTNTGTACIRSTSCNEVS